MDFTPRSQKELAESRLMPKGIYEFEIIGALEKPSKSSGKPMIELQIKVFRPDGSGLVLFDCLVEKRAEKLRHAAEVCGVLDRYNAGSLSDRDFHRKRGKLKLGIEKDKSHTWPDKNIVMDYVIDTGLKNGFAAFTQ